ncbi:hypothetical protein [Rhizobium sp. 2MFCol3.1]|uniref:hypothetical protein n=1 Tax=Rhizobium sp. 2MFCol3.1 TaxID=1246459 RepID=UPI0012DD6DD7|nr:hypothetical protein [Rhizobium sp. 2MFCol3.1]
MNAQEDKETQPVFATIGKNRAGFDDFGSSFCDFRVAAVKPHARVLRSSAQKKDRQTRGRRSINIKWC